MSYKMPQKFGPEGALWLDFFHAVATLPQFSQRLLAARLGISLGRTNQLMQQALQAGYLTSQTRRQYQLTAAGKLVHNQLAIDQLTQAQPNYLLVRTQLNTQLAALADNGLTELSVAGTGLITDMATALMSEHETFTLLAHLTQPTALEQLPPPMAPRGVLITDADNPAVWQEALGQRYPHSQIFTALRTGHTQQEIAA